MTNTLREALEVLEKAATQVSRYGAQTGPQWPALTTALIKARAALSQPSTPPKVEDGNVPSKCGRDGLFDRGLIDRADGWQWLTRSGVMLALGMGLDREKEKRQREKRIPR